MKIMWITCLNSGPAVQVEKGELVSAAALQNRRWAYEPETETHRHAATLRTTKLRV